MISSIIPAFFKTKIQSNMSEQKKKWQSIYDLPGQSFFVYCIQSKEKMFTEKELFMKKWEWSMEQKTKRWLITALAMVIKKDPTMSIGKNANELKAHEKTEDNN